MKRKLVRLTWDNWKSRGKAVNHASFAWFSYHSARMDEIGQRPADEKQDQEGSGGKGGLSSHCTAKGLGGPLGETNRAGGGGKQLSLPVWRPFSCCQSLDLSRKQGWKNKSHR